MSDEELNELEHAARTSVAGGLAWRLGKALASVRAEHDEQESEKNAERDALRAELADARLEIDAGRKDNLFWRQDVDALRAQLDEAREALKPFARTKIYPGVFSDDERWSLTTTVKDVRRARAVYEKIKGDGDE